MHKIKAFLLFGCVFMLFTSSMNAGTEYRWRKKLSGLALGNPLAYNPQNPNTLYGALSSGENVVLYVSRDRGETWSWFSTIPTSLFGSFIKSIIVHSRDSLQLLVGVEIGSGGKDKVLKSDDGGGSWVEVFSADFSYYGVPLESNPHHPDTVYVMSNDSLFRSSDFGSSWLLVSRRPGFNAWCDAALRDDSVNIMYVGDNTSGIWRTSNGGVTFSRVFTTVGEIPMIAIDPLNPAVGYATMFGYRGGFLKTTDFGTTWNQVAGFADLHTWGVAVARFQPKFVVTGIYTNLSNPRGLMFLSSDSGQSWNDISFGLQNGENYGLLALDSSTIISLQGDGIYKLYSTHTIIRGTVIDSATGLPVTNGYITLIGVGERYDLSRTNGTFTFAHIEGEPTTARVECYPYYVVDVQLSFIPDSTVEITIPLRRAPLLNISGTLYNRGDSSAIKGNILLWLEAAPFSVGGLSQVTDSDGRFLFQNIFLPRYESSPVTVALTASGYPCYTTYQSTFLGFDTSIDISIYLPPLPRATLSGIVRDAARSKGVISTLRLVAQTPYEKKEFLTVTDLNGNFTFPDLVISYPDVNQYLLLEVSPDFPYKEEQIVQPTLAEGGNSFTFLVEKADVFVFGEDSTDVGRYYRAALDSLGLKARIWNTLNFGIPPVSNARAFSKNIVIYYSDKKTTPLTAEELFEMSTYIDSGGNLFLSGQNIIEANDSTDFVRRYLGVSFGGDAHPFVSGLGDWELFSGLRFWTLGSAGAANQTSRDILVVEDSSAIPVLGYGTGNLGIAAIRKNSSGGRGRIILFGFGFESINTSSMQKRVMERVIGYLDGSLILNVDASLTRKLPPAFRLEQNYPNPFNPRTRIRYSLPSRGLVRLTVYDIVGREIVTLVDNIQTEGHHSVEWDASSFPSGVYLYEIFFEGRREVKKMVVMK
jgi:photosystem II stability/assembly factor-like uncharacterized protein